MNIRMRCGSDLLQSPRDILARYRVIARRHPFEMVARRPLSKPIPTAGLVQSHNGLTEQSLSKEVRQPIACLQCFEKVPLQWNSAWNFVRESGNRLGTL